MKTRLPLTIVFRGLPLSYQRYSTSKTSKTGRRFQPAELRAYQRSIATSALVAGIKSVDMPDVIEATCFFFLPPMSSEKKRAYFSLDPKDLDNLTKAAIDGLKSFFNDRIIVMDRHVKVYVQDRSLWGTVICLEKGDWRQAVGLMKEKLQLSETSTPWLRYIQTLTSS